MITLTLLYFGVVDYHPVLGYVAAFELLFEGLFLNYGTIKVIAQ